MALSCQAFHRSQRGYLPITGQVKGKVRCTSERRMSTHAPVESLAGPLLFRIVEVAPPASQLLAKCGFFKVGHALMVGQCACIGQAVKTPEIPLAA